MKGIPPELFYALIFVGVILYQFVMRQRARKAEQARQAELQSRSPALEPEPAADNFLDFGRLEQPAPIAWTPPPVQIDSSGPAMEHAWSRAPAAAVAAPAAGPRRRFPRQALLGSRRALQDAMVIAVILGRCRGMDPPGGSPMADATGRAVR